MITYRVISLHNVLGVTSNSFAVALIPIKIPCLSRTSRNQVLILLNFPLFMMLELEKPQ